MEFAQAYHVFDLVEQRAIKLVIHIHCSTVGLSVSSVHRTDKDN